MKQMKSKILVIVVGMVMGLSSLAMAQGWNGPGYGKRGGGVYQRNGVGPVLRDKMRDARIEVLMDVTDQSRETVEAKLRYKPMWALLDEYKVDYVTFDKKMIAKRAEIIKQAVKDEQITEEMGELMLLRNKSGFGPGKGGFGPGPGRRGSRGWGQGGQRGGFGFQCQYN